MGTALPSSQSLSEGHEFRKVVALFLGQLAAFHGLPPLPLKIRHQICVLLGKLQAKTIVEGFFGSLSDAEVFLYPHYYSENDVQGSQLTVLR